MENFTFYQPVRLYFGPGKLSALSEILKELNIKRAILVCDPFLRDRAEKITNTCPEILGFFSEIEPNPQLAGAKAAAELAREKDAEAIIGMGGGSTMDTAKFAAAAAFFERTAEECYEQVRFAEKRPKVIAVPTTAGTGSEVTQVSVMSRGEEKKTMNNPAFMPAAAIVDPELMLTVPPKTTMMTGLDALAHALEGFWSIHHQPICDLYAEEAIRLIYNNLERAFKDGQDLEARTNMAYAALLAGLAFGQPKTAGCHACSYPLSQDYHLPHGEACAFTLDSFVVINYSPRLDDMLHRAGLKNGVDDLIRFIPKMRQMAGLRCTLPELGEEVDVDKLASDCAAHPLMQNNPVKLTKEDLLKLFDSRDFLLIDGELVRPDRRKGKTPQH